MLNKTEQLMLLAAAISLILSISLYFLTYKLEAIFVGLWVPTILSLTPFIDKLAQNKQ
jgi:hypothetical protein